MVTCGGLRKRNGFMPSILVPSCAWLHRQRRKYVVVAVSLMTVLVHIARSFLEKSGTTTPAPSFSSEVSLSAPRPLWAEDIIRRSYGRTFGALDTDGFCIPGVGGQACIYSLLLEAKETQSSNDAASKTAAKSFPWWFITMLRDIKRQSYVHGAWHNLTILDPPMDFCTIEKIATTQWRNVQCFLNEGIQPRKGVRPCQLNQTSLNSRRHEEVSRVVMLRDPLERLLSGYLNKCVDPLQRRGHCEPNSVFNDTDLTLEIREDPKQLFAAYVDGFPLKWDVHFFPQSMYCDGLFRHIDNYDFVGSMGKDFYGQLQNMTAKLGRGNKLPEALDAVFDLTFQLGVGRGNSNVGSETQAPKHVKKFYTAASVRRALEYFAVDYVRLGLEVPGWVHEILSEEEDLFTR